MKTSDVETGDTASTGMTVTVSGQSLVAAGDINGGLAQMSDLLANVPTTVIGMERSAQRLGRALVVVVDDRVTQGEYEDVTGPLVTELLEETGFIVDGSVVVPGEMVDIRNALNTAVIGGVDLVITVGGTGVSPRDVTPDATAGVLDRPVPGIAEALRASGLAAGAVDAGISRGLVGVSGSTLVVNIAGSRSAVRDGMATLSPLVTHVIEELSSLETP
ncbi:molybdenum cofactor synthesis domain-containing protein [Actinoalloteichus hoggarensis]|uniref:Molybdenum cofactor biosynthesis protein B n=2 Tax=Actinoalloteichus hoggarensis TaxID=1470176 RepID=A0A221VXL0_9PSEU|nr:Molybdenum cofactor biosynthesis protein B [Actinoalloteichus hoggarensis]MBB5921636.1 molybdenum cofactor synthesis domain-containing protein [Actinoalloteichus hoggarensis]